MINLLPPEHANAIRYGRQNTVLRVWLLSMAAAIVILSLIIAGGWFYLRQQANTLQKGIDITNQQLQSRNLSKVQADAKEITTDIKTINQVLGNEIRFSDLIQNIGKVMPSGAVLSSLKIGKVVGTLDLIANTSNPDSAAQVAANLSDPKNGLFTKVDVISVNCKTPDKPTPYPCTDIYKVLFSGDIKNKFLSVPRVSSS